MSHHICFNFKSSPVVSRPPVVIRIALDWSIENLEPSTTSRGSFVSQVAAVLPVCSFGRASATSPPHRSPLHTTRHDPFCGLSAGGPLWAPLGGRRSPQPASFQPAVTGDSDRWAAPCSGDRAQADVSQRESSSRTEPRGIHRTDDMTDTRQVDRVRDQSGAARDRSV